MCLSVPMASSSSKRMGDKGMPAEDKRARLNTLGRGTSYVSDRGKAAMNKDIKEMGIPEAASRNAFFRARFDVATSSRP